MGGVRPIIRLVKAAGWPAPVLSSHEAAVWRLGAIVSGTGRTPNRRLGANLSTERIPLYVPLLNEGTDVLRPTTGVFVGPDVLRIEAPGDYDPAIEEWEFPPGS